MEYNQLRGKIKTKREKKCNGGICRKFYNKLQKYFPTLYYISTFMGVMNYI